LRLTEEQHRDLIRKRATAAIEAKARIDQGNGTPTEAAPLKSNLVGVKRWQALGRLPKGDMNKTEAAYAAHLSERQALGGVLWWKFHPMRVRLASNTYYEVDFLVLAATGELEIHEVKGGYTSEKGQMKIKLCAEALPIFRMLKVSKLKGGGWNIEEF
jgi:hypothetical protein